VRAGMCACAHPRPTHTNGRALQTPAGHSPLPSPSPPPSPVGQSGMESSGVTLGPANTLVLVDCIAEVRGGSLAPHPTPPCPSLPLHALPYPAFPCPSMPSLPFHALPCLPCGVVPCTERARGCAHVGTPTDNRQGGGLQPDGRPRLKRSRLWLRHRQRHQSWQGGPVRPSPRVCGRILVGRRRCVRAPVRGTDVHASAQGAQGGGRRRLMRCFPCPRLCLLFFCFVGRLVVRLFVCLFVLFCGAVGGAPLRGALPCVRGRLRLHVQMPWA
jgi:hypothetical protein